MSKFSTINACIFLQQISMVFITYSQIHSQVLQSWQHVHYTCRCLYIKVEFSKPRDIVLQGTSVDPV